MPSNPENFNSGTADVDANGQIDIVDALLVAQFYVGLIKQLPGQIQTPNPTATPAPTPAPTNQPSGGNLVVNGGFETGDLSPWTIWNSARIADWKSHNGSFCSASAVSPASIEQRITVEPNSIYELSGYLLVDNAGEQVKLGVKNYGGNEISKAVTVNYWEFRSLRFTTNDYNTEATIYVYKSSGTGWGYSDDIQVIKVGTASGGPQPPSIDGNWQLVFQDEFEGNTLDTSKWSPDYPWGNTHNHRA